MRLLQLVTGPGELLDLHPHLTVVRGLDDAARAGLAAAVAGLAAGHPTGEGLLEAHGVLFDLDPDLLGLLEAGGGIDPVVRPGDLPGAGANPQAPVLRLHQRDLADLLLRGAEQAERHRQAEEARVAAEDAVARAVAARDAVEAVGASARADAERRAGEIEEQLRELEVERARLQADLDAPSTTAEAADRDEGHRAEAAAAAADPATRLEEIERRLELLDHLAATLAVDDTDGLREAHDALAGVAVDELVPSEEGQRLAEELEALAADLELTEPTGGAAALGDGEVAEVRSRLERARAAVREAEEARHPRQRIAPDDAAELEATHEALLEAIERAEGRFAGGRARGRVDDLRAAEEALLDRLGFISFSEYLMGTSSSRGSVVEDVIDAARDELSSAEDAWAEVERHTEAALARAEVLDRRRRARARARELLGPAWRGPAAVIEDLRSLRVPAPAPAELCDELRRELDRAGIDFGDETPEAEELLLMAEACLAEADHRHERLAALHDEQAALQAEAEELRRPPSTGPDRAPSPPDVRPLTAARLDRDGLAARLTELTSERDRLLEERASVEEALTAPGPHGGQTAAAEAAEVAQAEHERALQSLAAEAAVLAQLEAEAEAASAEVEPSEATVGPPVTATEVEASELEWYLLARVASQRAASVAGSLPLLLDDAFSGLPDGHVEHLLGRLDRMADTVQVIVVSEHPAVTTWAEGAGPARAAVVRPVPI